MSVAGPGTPATDRPAPRSAALAATVLPRWIEIAAAGPARSTAGSFECRTPSAGPPVEVAHAAAAAGSVASSPQAPCARARALRPTAPGAGEPPALIPRTADARSAQRPLPNGQRSSDERCHGFEMRRPSEHATRTRDPARTPPRHDRRRQGLRVGREPEQNLRPQSRRRDPPTRLGHARTVHDAARDRRRFAEAHPLRWDARHASPRVQARPESSRPLRDLRHHPSRHRG